MFEKGGEATPAVDVDEKLLLEEDIMLNDSRMPSSMIQNISFLFQPTLGTTIL
jgi:hypothetical protein